MTGETYESERKRALTRRSADLGLRRAPGRPVWGVVMEMGAEDGVTSVVATDDGAVSLLTSLGCSVHLTRSDWPHNAGARLMARQAISCSNARPLGPILFPRTA